MFLFVVKRYNSAMRLLKFYKMSEVPVGIKPRLRELTIGPVAWGTWSLTFHDGSTWCLIAFDDKETPENAIGWAALTFQYDVLPMVGVFVDEPQRGKGLAGLILSSMLQNAIADEILNRGDTVVASTWRWSNYEEVCESAGLKCQTWD